MSATRCPCPDPLGDLLHCEGDRVAALEGIHEHLGVPILGHFPRNAGASVGMLSTFPADSGLPIDRVHQDREATSTLVVSAIDASAKGYGSPALGTQVPSFPIPLPDEPGSPAAALPEIHCHPGVTLLVRGHNTFPARTGSLLGGWGVVGPSAVGRCFCCGVPVADMGKVPTPSIKLRPRLRDAAGHEGSDRFACPLKGPPRSSSRSGVSLRLGRSEA